MQATSTSAVISVAFTSASACAPASTAKLENLPVSVPVPIPPPNQPRPRTQILKISSARASRHRDTMSANTCPSPSRAACMLLPARMLARMLVWRDILASLADPKSCCGRHCGARRYYTQYGRYTSPVHPSYQPYLEGPRHEARRAHPSVCTRPPQATGCLPMPMPKRYCTSVRLHDSLSTYLCVNQCT